MVLYSISSGVIGVEPFHENDKKGAHKGTAKWGAR